ncbi:MAG: Rid family detoxifying hydrolase, partial [Cyanobacteria bacterium P01_A01_bin.137]
MVRRIVQTENAPAPVGPYNQAVVASGEMVFASGQVALDPDGTLVGTGDVAAQTKQCLDNLSAVLKAAGATLANVVKTSVFLKDMNDFGTMNGVYATYFDEA